MADGVEQKNKERFKFKIKRIEEEGFFLNTLLVSSIGRMFSERLIIEVKYDFTFGEKQNNIVSVIAKTRYSYRTEPSDDVMKLAEFGTINSFEVSNLEQIIDFKEDNTFKDNVGIVPVLLNSSIDTLRGVVCVRTAGTPLAEFPLPYFDAKTLPVIKPKKIK